MDVTRVVYDEIDDSFPSCVANPWLSESQIQKKNAKYEIVKQRVVSNLEKWRASDTIWWSAAVSNYARIKKDYAERGLLSDMNECDASPDLSMYFDKTGTTNRYLFPPKSNEFKAMLATAEGKQAMLEWEQRRQECKDLYRELNNSKNRKLEVKDWIKTRSSYIIEALEYVNMKELDDMEEHEACMYSKWNEEDKETKELKLSKYENRHTM